MPREIVPLFAKTKFVPRKCHLIKRGDTDESHVTLWKAGQCKLIPGALLWQFVYGAQIWQTAPKAKTNKQTWASRKTLPNTCHCFTGANNIRGNIHLFILCLRGSNHNDKTSFSCKQSCKLAACADNQPLQPQNRSTCFMHRVSLLFCPLPPLL